MTRPASHSSACSGTWTQIDVPRGARGDHRQPRRRRRCAGQRHLQHPPRPGDPDRQGQERVVPRRRASTPPRRPGTRPPPTTAPTSPAPSPARINGVGIAGVAPGVKVAVGEGRRRRGRTSTRRLPSAASSGPPRPRHADHQQQLLHRPVGVQLPQRRPAAPGLAGRPARHPLLADHGRAQHRVRRQLQRRPAAQVHRQRQPKTAATRSRSAPSTAPASTCRPRHPASSPCRRSAPSGRRATTRRTARASST